MTDFIEAFDGWSGPSGPDAPVKLILYQIFSEKRLELLAQLLAETPLFIGREVHGISGDPGWYLDRRSATDLAPEWPDGSEYKAELDPKFYAPPQTFFMSRETLLHYIDVVLPIYCSLHPDEADKVKALFSGE